MSTISNAVIEGFAVETADGSIFTVKGLLQPPDRVIAYLRYLPDPAGDRRRDGTPFRRVYRFDEQQEILRARYPQALVTDPVLGLPVQSVPRPDIIAVHNPVRFLLRLRRNGPQGPVEEDALALATLVQAQAGVAWENVGISGSLMLGTQSPGSDIDLIVYGHASGRAVHQALGVSLAQADGLLRHIIQRRYP